MASNWGTEKTPSKKKETPKNTERLKNGLLLTAYVFRKSQGLCTLVSPPYESKQSKWPTEKKSRPKRKRKKMERHKQSGLGPVEQASNPIQSGGEETSTARQLFELVARTDVTRLTARPMSPLTSCSRGMAPVIKQGMTRPD